MFSPAKIGAIVDPAVKGSKAAVEQRHLYPRALLLGSGITDQRQISQIANLGPVEWRDNLEIGASSQADYVSALDAALSAEERQKQYLWHALANLWWQLDYETCLRERRTRMAQVVRRAWEELTVNVEYKSAAAPLNTF